MAFLAAIGGLKGGSTLKKAKLALKYTDKEIEESHLIEHWSKNCTDRMLLLDEFRKHTILSSESSTLNVTEGRRLDMHALKDVLILCGGCKGNRFESSEFTFITKLTKILPPLYDTIDNYFKSDALAGPKKKKVLESNAIGQYMKSYEEDRAAQVMDDTMAATSEQDTVFSFSKDEDKSTTATATATATTSTTATTSSDSGDLAIALFHQYADSYTRLLSKLQSLIRHKQALLAQFMGSKEEGDNSIDLNNTDPDGLGDAGRAMPEWLEVLLQFYDEDGVSRLSIDESSSSSSIASNPRTIGKFSIFLACVIDGLVFPTKTAEVKQALFQLLQASNDMHVAVNQDMNIDMCLHSFKRGKREAKGVEYWAQRLFSFLVTVREIKSMVKDRDALTNPALFSPH